MDKKEETLDLVESGDSSLLPDTVDVSVLKEEANKLINEVIVEHDVDKVRDLAMLFNVNQTKKTMVRQNKLNDLLDTLVNTAANRASSHPDEMDNQQLYQSLKVVQDLVERSTKQIAGANDNVPLIQINQQNSEVTINTGDGSQKSLNREQRNRVKNVVEALLGVSAEGEVINGEATEPTNEVSEVEVVEEPEKSEVVEEATKVVADTIKLAGDDEDD